MKQKTRFFLIAVVFLVALFPIGQDVLAQGYQPVVQAVLFFSSSCPHCEIVINQDLPPLIDKYGDQLQIFGINTALPEGQTLYQSAITYFQIPPERRGVPTLIVADIVLVGSGEIPDQFPAIVENGLANGGIAWPSIPGLDVIIAESEFAEGGGESGSQDTPLTTELTMPERFRLDPVGNTVSVIVLIGMVLVVGIIVANFNRPIAKKDKYPLWLLPALVVIGISAASYLAFVEVSQSEAICGPVGDCNTVQQSKYATLFGFLPVGVLGVMGYILILFAWGIQHYGRSEWHRLASVALWGMAGFGTIFSIYLTFLEPFVIGATCMWCITSAVVQTAIFWLATEPAKKYLVKTKRKRRKRRKKR